MSLSAWLSLSTELMIMAVVLSAMVMFVCSLHPLRAVRYWWVRRERKNLRGVDPMQRLRLDAIVRMK